MKKWQMAAPEAGPMRFGALAALGVGIFQGQTALHAPVPQTAAVSAPAAWGRDSLFISVAEAAAADFMSYDTIKVQAIAESGLREGDLTNYEIKFDGRGYMPTYRVELETNAGGVDIDFDAKTGEIIDVREKSWKHSRTKLVISDYDVIEDVHGRPHRIAGGYGHQLHLSTRELLTRGSAHTQEFTYDSAWFVWPVPTQ